MSEKSFNEAFADFFIYVRNQERLKNWFERYNKGERGAEFAADGMYYLILEYAKDVETAKKVWGIVKFIMIVLQKVAKTLDTATLGLFKKAVLKAVEETQKEMEAKDGEL